MRVQWMILGGTGVIAIGFMVFLMVRLAFFEGHKSKLTEPKTRSAVATVVGSREKSEKAGAGGATTSAAVSAINLRRILLRLDRTSQPTRRAKIIQEAMPRSEEFEPHLLDILAVEHDEQIIPAIQLTGALGIQSASLPLMLLASADRIAVRVAAIEAREILDPWTDTELAEFLGNPEADPLLAVLKIITARECRPLPQLLRLLRHGKAAVREASAAALQSLSKSDDIDQLCRFAATAKGKPAWAAAVALGRPGFSERAEETLMRLLGSDDWVLRKTALTALGNKGAPLRDGGAVLAVVKNPKRSTKERAAGLMTMERTSTILVRELRSLIPQLDPVLKVFAARCLVSAGDSTGLATLIDLLDVVESKTVPFDDFLFATIESRALLTEFAGEDLGEKSDPWRRWHRANPVAKPRKVQREYPAFW